MTPKIALFYLVKNYPSRLSLAEKLRMPRSTFYGILNHTVNSIKFEHTQNIVAAVEELRENPTVNDCGLLIPTTVTSRWRFATRDSINVWTLFDSDYPPVYGSKGWTAPGYAQVPTMELNPALFRIPEDIDGYHDHLYQRDQYTGVWLKTTKPTAVQLKPHRTPVADEIDEICNHFINRDPAYNPVSNMLENNPYLRDV